MKNKGKLIKQLILVIIGTLIAAFGMDLAIHAGFGGATLAVLWKGLSVTFGITLGQASFIVAIIMILFSFFYDRKQISVGTVLYQVIYSFSIDLFAPLLKYSDKIIFNLILMGCGIIIFAIGTGIYSYANLGRGSYEALTFVFVEKHGFSIGRVRIVLDIICAVFGLILGGVVGICTVATIFLSGPTIQITVGFLKKKNFLSLKPSSNT